MDFERIESVLGHDTVAAFEECLERAYVAAYRSGDSAVGNRAVQELLLGLLAAAILTRGIDELAVTQDLSERLKQIVAKGLSLRDHH